METMLERAKKDLGEIKKIMSTTAQRIFSPLNHLSKIGLVTNRKTLVQEMESLIQEAQEKGYDNKIWLFYVRAYSNLSSLSFINGVIAKTMKDVFDNKIKITNPSEQQLKLALQNLQGNMQVADSQEPQAKLNFASLTKHN